jgi:hypothetical protein
VECSAVRRAGLLLGLVLTSAACTSWPGRETEPPIVGEPLPGSFYLVSNPQLAPADLTLRIDEEGGPSARSAQFAAEEEVIVNWSTLPLPRNKWIEVNGHDCEGTFEIRERFQTDLLLFLADDGTCRIEVRGMRPETNVQDLPPE